MIIKSKFRLLLFLHLFLVNLHLPLENLVCLLQGLLEHPHESVQVLLCVLRHQAHSQPGLTYFYHWELDSVDMHSHIHH